MNAVHRIRHAVLVATALLFAFLATGCSWLFAPDQSPGLTLAKRLGSVDAVREWTLEQRDAMQVMHGVNALALMADPSRGSDSSTPALDVTLEERCAAIQSLGAVAAKRATGWPDDAADWRGLDLENIYLVAAQSMVSESSLRNCYQGIEPDESEGELHGAWAWAGSVFALPDAYIKD